MGKERKAFKNLSRWQQKRRISKAVSKEFEEVEKRLSSESVTVVEVENENPLQNASQFLEDTVDDNINSVGQLSIDDDRAVETDSNVSIEEIPKTLSEVMRVWACTHSVKHDTLNDLLRELRNFGHPELPLDARTLLRTPRKNEFQTLPSGGIYGHVGIKQALFQQLRNINVDTFDFNDIYIDINVDGLPLAKSADSQLWPILGKIVNAEFRQGPFLIGAWHGPGKPKNVDEFLSPFIREYSELSETGFCYNGRTFRIHLHKVLADTPAKNFIRCFPAHNSRCGNCMQLGETRNGRRIFIEKNSPLRTDATFRSDLPAKFDNVRSPFETIGLSMTAQFPLDYMHLLCLGVTKKLLKSWINEAGKSVIAVEANEQMNQQLYALKEWIPIEFARKPRSLHEVDRWKATEFRLFLFYLGPIVLRGYLWKSRLIHFNSLNCAVRILADQRECLRNNEYSNSLLNYFTEQMEFLYGPESIIYNVHNLIHLSADVLKYGPLDKFSVFAFENYLQRIKKMVRKGYNPLAQIFNRISENSNIMPLKNPDIAEGDFLLRHQNAASCRNNPVGFEHFCRSIQFTSFELTNKKPNNVCYLIDGSIVLIDFICHKNNCPVIIGRQFINGKSMEDYPCDSRDIGIFKVKDLSTRKVWKIGDIDRKGFRIPYLQNYYVFPILHTGL